MNIIARLLVDQSPARATVGDIPFDVECATDKWEAGEIPEERVSLGETRARNVGGRATRFVVNPVPRDFNGVDNGREGFLAVVIRGVVTYTS